MLKVRWEARESDRDVLEEAERGREGEGERERERGEDDRKMEATC